MKHFKIGFSTPKQQTILTKLIKKQQNINFSHVFLSFFDTEVDRWVIYQATLNGVNFLSIEEFEKYNIIISDVTFDITEEQKRELKNWAIDNLGRKYSIKQLVYIYLYEERGIKLEFLKSDDYWICCEAAARALVILKLIPCLDYDMVDLRYTKEILEKLDNNKY